MVCNSIKINTIRINNSNLVRISRAIHHTISSQVFKISKRETISNHLHSTFCLKRKVIDYNTLVLDYIEAAYSLLL